MSAVDPGTASAVPPAADRLLIALDVDGTVLTEAGELRADAAAAVARLRDAGHEVMLATGRGVALTLPVLDRLLIAPRFVVCANGAITLERDPDAPLGYRRRWVETFDPTAVLRRIRPYLEQATYVVEDAEGEQLYVGQLPDVALDAASRRVRFDELLHRQATRVVVMSEDHTADEFIGLVDEMGLDHVSYNVGWAAWLDIAPQGVTKATGLERARRSLGVPLANLVAIGDGRNDIEMFGWAGAAGRAIAMGQAPEEVRAAAGEITYADVDGGLAHALAMLG
ncbi:MAG: HAD hydrolase family protein [Microbacteriaceae bacterium]